MNQPEVRVTLFRKEESVPAEHSKRPVLDRERRHAAARQLLAEMLPRRRDSNYFYGELTDMLFRIDPEAALESGDPGPSRAFLHHLFRCGEITGKVLATLHNLRFYLDFMQDLRKALRSGSSLDLAADVARWDEPAPAR